MPEIKHNFTAGKMNKDFDERLVKNGEYRDAMNVQVSTSEDSEVGTVQNLLGNFLLPGQDFISQYATCVGSISNESEDKLYYFITNTDFLTNPNFSLDINNNGFADYWSPDSGGWSYDAQNKRHVGNNVSLYNKIKQSSGLKGELPLGTAFNIRCTLSCIDENDPSTIGSLGVAYYNSNGDGFNFGSSDFSPSNRSYDFTGLIGDNSTTNTGLYDEFFVQRVGSTELADDVEKESVTYGRDIIIEDDKTTNNITTVVIDTVRKVLKLHYKKVNTVRNILDAKL